MSAGALRTILAIAGGLAGLAYWLILDEGVLRGLPMPAQLFIAYFAVAFFPAFGLIAGPIAPPRAAGLAAVLAAFGAGLVAWAGLRFTGTDVRNSLEPTGEGLFLGPFIALTTLLVPFAIAWATDRSRWRDYTILFDTAWSAVVKASITLLFVALFWVVYFLSNALLELVGIDILEDIAGEDWGWPLITGLVAGLTLAVTCELDTVILTLRGLILRLFRLLLIPVTLVIGVFLLAVVVQGLGDVFRGWSAATTMMLMAAGSVTLIAAVLGHDDTDASTNRTLILFSRALALMLPVIAAFAVYAVWLRIAQYGWTPPRLAAFLISLIVVAYALPPALHAGLAREGWMGRIRQRFVLVVLAIIAIATLWFTPALNAQRIAANDQYARIVEGRIDLDEFRFWPMAREWGNAGLARVEDLRAATDLPDHARISDRIEAALSAEYEWQANNTARAENASELWEELRTRMPTIPEGRTIPDASDFPEVEDPQAGSAAVKTPFYGGDLHTIRRMIDACDTPHPEGYPLCLAVFGDFFTDLPGDEILYVTMLSPTANPDVYYMNRRPNGYSVFLRVQTEYREDWPDLIAALRAGNFTIVPPPVQGLRVGDIDLMPGYQ